jgi:hypothetical protein
MNQQLAIAMVKAKARVRRKKNAPKTSTTDNTTATNTATTTIGMELDSQPGPDKRKERDRELDDDEGFTTVKSRRSRWEQKSQPQPPPQPKPKPQQKQITNLSIQLMDFDLTIDHLVEVLNTITIEATTANRLTEIVSHLTKVHNDVVTNAATNKQIQADETTLSEVVAAVKILGQQVQRIEQRQIAPTPQQLQPTNLTQQQPAPGFNPRSYANTVKETTIVVKSIDGKIEGSTTLKEIQKNVARGMVTGYKELPSGDVLLRAKDKTAATAINQKLAEASITSTISQKLNPRVCICNVDPEFLEINDEKINNDMHKLLDKIKEENEFLHDATPTDIKPVTILGPGRRSVRKLNRLIVEVSQDMYKKMMAKEHVIFDFTKHKIFDHDHAGQCWKCADFGHKPDACPGAAPGIKLTKFNKYGRPVRAQCCLHCGSRDHLANECKSRNPKCVNCFERRSRPGASNTPIDHSAASHSCPCYQDRLRFVASRVSYGDE